MIDIKEEFEVPASPDRVWEIISNPYEVVGCVPGAELKGQREDGQYEGSIGIKFGPTNVGFQTLVALDLDAARKEGKVSSTAKDKRGGTRTKATATFNVEPSAAGSKVTMQSSVDISGPLASLVETGANFVVKRLVTAFAERLTAKLAGESQPGGGTS